MNITHAQFDRLTSFVLVIVSAMMLAAPGSSVTGMKGRDEAPEAEGVIADDGVTASSDEGTCSNTQHMVGPDSKDCVTASNIQYILYFSLIKYFI